MRKVIVVAVREYQAAVRSKAFIIALLALPVFMGGGIFVQMLMKDRVDISDKRIGIVDRSGKLFDALAKAAEKNNSEDVFTGKGKERKQVKPKFVLSAFDASSETIDELALELSDRVRNKELFAFAIISPDVATLETKAKSERGPVLYHSNNPTYSDVPDWLAQVINREVQTLRLRQLNLDPEVVQQATRRIEVDFRQLLSRDESGTIQQAEKANRLAGIFVPMGFMMLMFAMIMVGAQPLMHSTLEEKMNRIAEVLLASVSPFQLMMGKLLGMVAVSLTMLTIYLGTAAYGVFHAGYGSEFPGHLVIWFVVFQVLAVLMFGSVFCAVGAAVTDLKEAQSLVMPVMLIVVAPMFIWLNVVREPNATSSVVMSLFPPATPMLMVLRQSTPEGVPTWQPVLGIGLVLLVTAVCVFAAGRIFRVGILMQGKGAKLGEMMRWAVRG
ncbi:MAG: ABC transporter permease [Phycisphaerales bacterium]|nr:MAG: ABC transporter permease [Phycisphaerales bacterium]